MGSAVIALREGNPDQAHSEHSLCQRTCHDRLRRVRARCIDSLIKVDSARGFRSSSLERLPLPINAVLTVQYIPAMARSVRMRHGNKGIAALFRLARRPRLSSPSILSHAPIVSATTILQNVSWRHDGRLMGTWVG